MLLTDLNEDLGFEQLFNESRNYTASALLGLFGGERTAVKLRVCEQLDEVTAVLRFDVVA